MSTLRRLRRKPSSKAAVDAELSRRFTACLSNARLDHDATIGMMKATNTILSGSAALEMVMPGTCVPGDLDFYCPVHQAPTVAAFFNGQGYECLPPPNGVRAGYGCLSLGLSLVLSMRHRDDPTKKVNVVQSLTPSPLAPVLFFHSTPVMNFVTWEGYGVLYPGLTFAKKGTHCVQDSQPHVLNNLV